MILHTGRGARLGGIGSPAEAEAAEAAGCNRERHGPSRSGCLSRVARAYESALLASDHRVWNHPSLPSVRLRGKGAGVKDQASNPQHRPPVPTPSFPHAR